MGVDELRDLVRLLWKGSLVKERLQKYLCCLKCRGNLDLRNARWESGEIWEAELECAKCAINYPVKDGIPRFIPKDLDQLVAKNVRNFGDQWHVLDKCSEINRTEFISYLENLSPDFFEDKLILDAGCGMGKFLYYSSQWGALDVIGVDLSHSVEVAFQWTRELPNAHIVQGDIYNLPFQEGFDFTYSIGVLHHLPDPEGGFHKLVKLLRPGGKILAWVYGYEGNQLYIKLADPVRRLTCRLPLFVNKLMAQIIAAVLWVVIRLVYLPSNRLKLRGLPFNDYFLYFYGLGFPIFWGTVLDKMTPFISRYYRREEFEQWFVRAGLSNVRITPRNANSWRGEGVKA